MWFLKNSGWLLIFIVAGLFGYQNRNETVSAVHLAGRNYTLQPLIIVVFVAFVIGTFTMSIGWWVLPPIWWAWVMMEAFWEEDLQPKGHAVLIIVATIAVLGLIALATGAVIFSHSEFMQD